MKLTILGTGNAAVTECYNTCFMIENEALSADDNGVRDNLFLVDGGGGSAILKQIKDAGYDWKDIKHIFVTHKHIDHIMGIIWLVRMITQSMHQGKYEGDVYIYGHDEVIELIRDMSEKLLQPKPVQMIGKRLHLVELESGDEFIVIGTRCVAFDIGSTKAKQFGFTMYYNDNKCDATENGSENCDVNCGDNQNNGSSVKYNKKLTCCGDEPYKDCEFGYAINSDWLMHEAFCLSSEADIFKPYEKHHTTAKDACELAAKLNVKNVIMYHTEDKNILNRKELYTAEGREYFSGNIYVPDDLEVIEI